MGKMISFVIPCYRSQATLPSVIREIQETMEGLSQYTYEVVLVNDCSPDELDQVMDLCLRKTSFGYDSCRNMGEISMAHVELLSEGSFEKYEKYSCFNN